MQVVSALCVLLLATVISARRRRKSNEIHVINESNRNLRLHCQSILTDLHALFVDDGADFKWNFYDIDRDNTHFWCDAYGLDNFFEQFDVFGEMAPLKLKNTWILKPDGLYHNDNGLLQRVSTWMNSDNNNTTTVSQSLFAAAATQLNDYVQLQTE